MAQAGCRELFPLCNHAVMGVAGVLAALPQIMSLISQADRYFRHKRPDAVILIDYPGFNWWMARRAHFHGIPVFYFVPPQLWGWAGWRLLRSGDYPRNASSAAPMSGERISDSPTSTA